MRVEVGVWVKCRYLRHDPPFIAEVYSIRGRHIALIGNNSVQIEDILEVRPPAKEEGA